MPVEIHVGQECGIAYKQEHARITSHLADLKNVVNVSIRRMDRNTDKWIVQVKVSAKPTPIVRLLVSYSKIFVFLDNNSAYKRNCRITSASYRR